MKRPAWQSQGKDPDYRFTLANERTFLAWIRTALAVLAGGVLLDQFAGHIAPRGVLSYAALALALLGASLAVFAYVRWKGNEVAMRLESGLPPAHGIPLLCAITAIVALVLASGLLLK